MAGNVKILIMVLIMEMISATENKILMSKYLDKNLIRNLEENDDILRLENKLSKRDSNSEIGVTQMQHESMSEGITDKKVI